MSFDLLKYFRLLAVLVLLSSCRESIIHDLPESGANKIVARLNAAGIDAEKSKQSDGLWAITLEQQDSIRAITYLDRIHLLPRAPVLREDNAGFLTNKGEQRFANERRVSAAIEETLSNMPGVLEARVHLNMPESDALSPEESVEEGSASVLVIIDGAEEVSAKDVEALIAGASGTRADNIKVILSRQPHPMPFVLEPNRSEAGLPGSFAESRRLVEAGLWVFLLVAGATCLWIGARPLLRRKARPA